MLFVLPLLSAALFAGCCGSVACDCQNYRTDALIFRFSADSTGGTGFRAAELTNVVLVRYNSIRPGDSLNLQKTDTVRLTRTRATAFTPVVIDNTEPFTQRFGRKLGTSEPRNSHRYAILLTGAARNSPVRKRYFIGGITLTGKVEADGCCTCYENTQKSFYLNNTFVEATSGPGNPPIETTLTR
ncbi:hypothetical protein ASU33_18510 [Solirubrum puertoriconensis]|uniref:Uncharacterized protein n=1 Tax=Solirubrum puertoriconensis TaxID=1751427 RepID=A0A9X0L6F9_SOLP1|nr:hypothetical protein ASU33_18510 [Solirubrum puertoriconensis]